MWPFRPIQQRVNRRHKSVVVSDRSAGDGAFSWLRGRKYLASTPYLLPKDLQESNRLDFQHYAIRYALRGNYAVPLQQPRAILDVGTGTGRWAREVATIFPQATVIGCDIVEPPVDEQAGQQLQQLQQQAGDSRQQATHGVQDPRPPNYMFVTANVLAELPFPDATFDFVHQRLMMLAVPAARWPFVVSELVRVTTPGGWVELVESGLLLHTGPATERYQSWTQALGERRGVDMRVTPTLGELLERRGLAQVEHRLIEVPLGRWGGRLGQMMAQNILAAFTSVRPALLGTGLASEQEFNAVLEAIPHEWEQRHTTAPFYVYCGQRPLA